jgi:hypothetical protein
MVGISRVTHTSKLSKTAPDSILYLHRRTAAAAVN